MATYREAAATELSGALAAHTWDQMAAKASIATTYAVLALLDHLQQEENTDLAQAADMTEAFIQQLEAKIRHLEEDLEGARAALRARDDALNTEMKANKEARGE